MKRTVKIKATCSNNEDEILLIGSTKKKLLKSHFRTMC